MAFNYTTTWLDNNMSVTAFHTTTTPTPQPTRRRRTPQPTSAPTPDPKKCFNKCTNTLNNGEAFKNTTVDPLDPTSNIGTTCQNICGYYTTATPTTPTPFNIFNFTSSTTSTTTLPISTIQTSAPTADPRKCWTKCRNTLVIGDAFKNTTVDPQDSTTNIDNTCSNLCQFYTTAIPTSSPTSSQIPTASPTPDPKKCFSKCQSKLIRGDEFKNTTVDPQNSTINIPTICSDVCDYQTTAEPTTLIPTASPTVDAKKCFLKCKTTNSGMYNTETELIDACSEDCSFTPQIETTHYNDTLNWNISTPAPTVDAQRCFRKCKNTFPSLSNATNVTQTPSFDVDATCSNRCNWYISTTTYNSTGRGGRGRNNTRRANGGGAGRGKIDKWLYDAENMELKQTLLIFALIFLCSVMIATALALTIKKKSGSNASSMEK